ncbi:MAG TPA: 4-alpha-glucanotransferase, partial [Verrucomicrobiae bacterium]|nr:4-alpha-glucanotransferase [Verrucomicrobiae bacterium]
MDGRRQVATRECLQGILAGLGIAAETEAECRESLRELELRKWRQALEPVILNWEGARRSIGIRLPSEAAARGVTVQVRLEDGTSRELKLRAKDLRLAGRAEIDGARFVEGRFRLRGLPFGYHEIRVQIRGRRHVSRLISAPSRAYAPPGRAKAWGLFVPMYALHSGASWGAGNLGDYDRLCSWTRSLGGAVVAPLPLLGAFLDSPACEPSPYSPASRLFWNEFYLDIARTPEFAACRAAQRLVHSAAFQMGLERFRKSPTVDYQAEMAARRAVLEARSSHFSRSRSTRRREYEAFLRANPAAVDYAEFRAACDRRRTGWSRWDERMRHGRLERGDYSEQAKAYHLFCQWLMQEQLSGLLDRFRQQGGRFHLDLPLGVHPDGYDVWRWRDAFAPTVSAGAPPDMFFTKGQNWGFAPLHPQRLRERGYEYVLNFLRFQMRHTGLLRIDHVMGLHRLYWIPSGLPPDQGTYVRYPAEELFAILCLESHRNRTVIIGENLGTVPPEITTGMREHELRETYVAQFAQTSNPHRPLAPPPRRCVAMINTHDMPTFKAHW